jgi:hypothetical protein
MNTQQVTSLLCECGCGQPVPIAKRNRFDLGYIKGQPLRYVLGHNASKSDAAPPNPGGLCLCGCGSTTRTAKKSDSRLGWVKGHHVCYVNAIHAKRQAITERFWEKVDKRGPNDCWLWLASKNRKGYGSFTANGYAGRAHRFSYQLHYGPIPTGMFVCHNCPGGDNPACVNPAHLWLGTTQQNTADMVSKRRNKMTSP